MEKENKLETMRHSLSHVMAQAVLELFPDAKLGIGPAIEEGFYYDFDLGEKSFGLNDLKDIEKKMKKIISGNQKFEKYEEDIKKAITYIKKKKQPYKLELAKDLEKEFASTLFQLGTRIGDGIPAEVAFSDVAKNMEGTPSGNFFRIVDTNIRNLGMGLREAIFNVKTGAVLNYPSPLITSSMEVLLESSKKGPSITAQALLSISNYVERIHSVNERLKDLLSEIISSMKSQISFLTPAIAGIVIGIASMIVNIIVQLGTQFQEFQAGEAAADTASTLSLINSLFTVKDIIPSFFFQIVVGLYVFQITYILIILSNGIENGTDKLNDEYLLGKNLIKTTVIYTIIAVIVVILFNVLSQGIMSGVQV